MDVDLSSFKSRVTSWTREFSRHEFWDQGAIWRVKNGKSGGGGGGGKIPSKLTMFFEGTEIEFRCRVFYWIANGSNVGGNPLVFTVSKKLQALMLKRLNIAQSSVHLRLLYEIILQSCSLPYCYPGWKSLNIQKSNRIQTGGLIWYIIPNRNGCESLMWKRVFSSYQRVSLQSAGNVSALA